MRLSKRILSVILCMIMVLGTLAVGGEGFSGALSSLIDKISVKASAATSGTCGDNLSWTFENGELTISGEGEMIDFYYTDDQPWFQWITEPINDVVIEYGVTRIGSNAFISCGIKSISIPYSVTSIGSSAFENCHNLTSVTIPDSVTSIGDYVLSGCSGLTSITVDSGNTVYHSEGNCLIKTGSKTLISGCKNSIIPDDGSVTKIGYVAFWGCTDLTSITIPDSITSIGDSAFNGCSGLTNITIPDSVTSIGIQAFSNCTGLTSITIPDSVTSIGDSAFERCTGLTSITVDSGNTVYHSDGNCLIETESKTLITGCKNSIIPDGNSVTIIGGFAFYECTGLTSVTIPDSVTDIGDGAFSNCGGLTSITIPDSVTSIGKEAFRLCTNLTSITIPDSVTSIGKEAFYKCTGLTRITVGSGNTVYHSEGNCLIETESKILITGCNNSIIPDDGSVTSIGDDAFFDCTGLTSIAIPDSVNNIGNYAFGSCTGLTSVTIGNGVTIIGDFAFYECNGLTSVTIGNSVTRICNSAFSDCTGITSVNIPDGVTNIGGWAFFGCTGLTDITIPDSVTSIGDYAFLYCENLTDVYFTGSEEEWSAIVVGEENNYLLNANIHFGVNDAEPAISGKCGDNLTWSYNSNTQTLTISGKGKMEEFDYDSINGGYYSSAPWWQYHGSVKQIIIDNGVTNIGDYAFYECTELTSFTIPDGVTSIGKGAFVFCSSLASITIPDSIVTIGFSAFGGSTAITDIYFQGTHEEWDAIKIGTLNSELQTASIYYLHGLSGAVLNKTTSKLASGKTEKLQVSFAPKGASDKVIWSSDNESVITVDETGLVTAVSEGTATVTATTVHNGFTSSCTFTVTNPVSKVSLNKKSISIIKGKTEQLTATVAPKNASNKGVTWKSSDETVATVSDMGQVKAKKVGKATITVTTKDGDKTATCNVTVKNEVINVTSVKLNKTKLNMYNNTCDTLISTVYPRNATTKKVTWTSSNKNVVTVDDGMLTAVGLGTSKITVTTKDGNKKASCTVTVKQYEKDVISETVFNTENTGRVEIEFDANDLEFNANNYNHDLARFCSLASLCTYSGIKVLSKTLNNLGFVGPDTNRTASQRKDISKITLTKDCYFYWPNEKDTTSGRNCFVITKKNYVINGKSQNVVLVLLRGTYGKEWYSNFDCGTDKIHKDFKQGSDFVLSYLKTYLKSNDLQNDKNLKIIITGHSRGAAVANLMGYSLDKDFNNHAANYLKTSKNNVFIYTFATPNVSNRAGSFSEATSVGYEDYHIYNNIYNFVNPEDFVTKVMPAQWGYRRYGTTYTLPSKTNGTNNEKKSYSSYKNEMNKLFKQYFKMDYQNYPDGEETVYSVMNKFTSTVKSAKQYYNADDFRVNIYLYLTPYEYFESGICNLCCIGIASTEQILSAGIVIYDSFKSIFACETYKKFTEFFLENAVLGKAKDKLTEATASRPLINSLIKSISVSHRFEHAHCAETYAAFLNSMTESEVTQKRKGYKGTVNCPVDIVITDKETDEVVGKITNNVVDEAISAKENSVVMSVEGDSKTFWLPSDGDYDIQLIGNAQGEMDCTLSTIDSDIGEIERVNFFDNEVQEGFVYSLGIPTEDDYYNDETVEPDPEDSEDPEPEEYISPVSIKDAVLVAETGEVIEPAEYLEAGNEELNTLTVDVTIDGVGYTDEHSTVSKGDYLYLTASTDENNSFIGWFDENGRLLSSEENYGFVVTENTNLVAEFTDKVVPVESFSFSEEEMFAVLGEEFTPVITYQPENANLFDFELISSDESIVSVTESGALLAENCGTAVITAISDENTASCKVTVIKSEYTVKWIVDGDETSEEYSFGDEIIMPESPVKEGYTFIGWSPDVPATMPANDLTFTAVFEKNPAPSNPTASAKLKVPSNTEVEYASTVTVKATAADVPEGYYVALYDGKTLLAKGSNTEVSYTFPGEFKETKNITVKIIDDNENVQKDAAGKELTGTVEIKAKSGFFAKLIAFFKRLFRALPKVTVEPK